jgi:hypothetical protein
VALQWIVEVILKNKHHYFFEEQQRQNAGRDHFVKPSTELCFRKSLTPLIPLGLWQTKIII